MQIDDDDRRSTPAPVQVEPKDTCDRTCIFNRRGDCYRECSVAQNDQCEHNAYPEYESCKARCNAEQPNAPECGWRCDDDLKVRNKHCQDEYFACHAKCDAQIQ